MAASRRVAVRLLLTVLLLVVSVLTGVPERVSGGMPLATVVGPASGGGGSSGGGTGGGGGGGW